MERKHSSLILPSLHPNQPKPHEWTAIKLRQPTASVQEESLLPNKMKQVSQTITFSILLNS